MKRVNCRTDRLCQILLALLLITSCSPRHTPPGGSILNDAIALYISGRYDEARDQLKDLAVTLRSDSDRATAHLYLARCYEALGEYEAAWETFTSGMMIGGDTPFYDHIQVLRSRIEADPIRARRQPDLTRAQLACLLDRILLLGESEVHEYLNEPKRFYEPLPPDMQNHWAEEPVHRVMRAGIMKILPDSLFHPDEKVTKAVFFFVVQSLQNSLFVKRQSIEELFPGGYESIIRAQLNLSPENAAQAFVSGREVVSILEKLSIKVDSTDG